MGDSWLYVWAYSLLTCGFVVRSGHRWTSIWHRSGRISPMASKAAAGSVRKIRTTSCSQFQRCTCGGRGSPDAKPCPKAQRCRCDGRWQARITAPNGSVVKAPTTFRAKIDAEEWVKAERALMEDPATYVTAQARLQAAKEQARRDAANTLDFYAEQYLSGATFVPTPPRSTGGS